jgi:hypothetical protein
MKTIQSERTISILILCVLLALIAVPLGVAASGTGARAKRPAAQGAVGPLTGSYSGSVSVDEPTSLGELDLVFTVTEQNGALSGKVNAAKTQVFLGGPTFTGSVTTSQGITPTFRIDSEVFTGLVSGRTVQRQFTLIGEMLNDADTLRGQYTETIIGFTPKPLLVKGKFLLVRPSGSKVIIDEGTATPTQTPTVTGTPPTATSTATPTATRPGNPGQGGSNLLYLPLISQNSGTVSSAAATATPSP